MSISDELYEIVWLSRPLMQAAEARVEQGLQSTELTVRMRAVLEVLSKHGDLTVPDIALRLEINRQYVQLMVNETITTGLTEHRVNPRHKRSPLIGLTDKGRTLILDVIANEMRLMERLSAGFTPDEVSTALRVVRGITQKLRSNDAGDA